MKQLFILLFFVPILVFAAPDHVIIPQQRIDNETFQQSLNKIKKKIPSSFMVRENPLNKKVPLKEIDFSLAPVVTAHAELMSLFYLIRDKRFLYEETMPAFARRISWLYPDDGCFSRAAMVGITLDRQHFIRPAKIFAFGDLVLDTPYSPKGAVYWWYHVASVVNYLGTIYVLDPALNADAPMLVEDWYNKMGHEEGLSGVVCNPYTYDPFDYCFKASAKSDAHAQRDQEEYLDREWGRMQSLGLDPLVFLGDDPPWLPRYMVH